MGWFPGITIIETSDRAGAGFVSETVTFDDAERIPLAPVPVAVITAVPEPTALTTPLEFTVATDIFDEPHVTALLMFCVVTG